MFWVTIGSNTNLHLTLINLFSAVKGGLTMCVWEISEGHIKNNYATKLVPPKDLGSDVHLNTIH